MTHTITRTYDSQSDATAVIAGVKALGITESDISAVANKDHLYGSDGQPLVEEDWNSAAGASIGGAIGGGAGLLAGLGMMAIPGIGPLVATGWFATTAAGAFAGATAGGLLGALSGNGVPEHEAETHAEAIRRGSILVSVRTSEASADAVLSVMEKYNPTDLPTRRAVWERDGWQSHDPAIQPLTRDELRLERERHKM